jgi:hypothetical protein
MQGPSGFYVGVGATVHRSRWLPCPTAIVTSTDPPELTSFAALGLWHEETQVGSSTAKPVRLYAPVLLSTIRTEHRQMLVVLLWSLLVFVRCRWFVWCRAMPLPWGTSHSPSTSQDPLYSVALIMVGSQTSLAQSQTCR